MALTPAACHTVAYNVLFFLNCIFCTERASHGILFPFHMKGGINDSLLCLSSLPLNYILEIFP